ncbi:hypothetical protein LTR66_011205 [Elasticomyces elasticus]|nr:hypothetical protein LTR66_011205 [Elasticomyces elasticus]KAK5009981.1 hypothetical protein LTR28_012381 [Elasticomyces elasticus]
MTSCIYQHPIEAALTSICLNLVPRHSDTDLSPVTDAKFRIVLAKVGLRARLEASAHATEGHSSMLDLPPILPSHLTRGQQQRFCLTQAMLSPPSCPILVVNEATSELDAKQDAHVQKSPREGFSG